MKNISFIKYIYVRLGKRMVFNSSALLKNNMTLYYPTKTSKVVTLINTIISKLQTEKNPRIIQLICPHVSNTDNIKLNQLLVSKHQNIN